MVSDRLDSEQDRLHVADAGNQAQVPRERENRELRQANEILRKASAYFARAELDRRHKP